MLRLGIEANDVNSSLVPIKNDDDSENQKKPWCDHCKKNIGTFSSIAKLNSIIILLSIVINLHWSLQ